MKKLIYLSILFFFWGCMFEETPQEISSSSEQPRNGLALLFEQKLNARLLTRSGELEMQLKERHIQIRQLQDSLQDSGKKRSALEKEIAALQGKLRDILWKITFERQKAPEANSEYHEILLCVRIFRESGKTPEVAGFFIKRF